MKNRTLKRMSAILLLVVMTCLFCSCGEQKVVIEPMKEKEVHAISFDIIGGKDVMPIAGYYGPTAQRYSVDGQSRPDYYTDEIFSRVAECGINMFTYSSTDYVNYPQQVKKMLELGEKYNLGITVTDSKISGATVDSSISLEDLAARLAEYCDYPAFCGVYVVDEPGSQYFRASENQVKDTPVFAPVFKNLNELGVWGYGNLNPVWRVSDYQKYEQMVAEYCELCNPTYLSWDHYVWDEGRTVETYFYNMDLIRKYAEKYEIPFWSFVQAGSQWNDAKETFDTNGYYPSEGQMRWSANTSLAYGAKGLQYFPVLQPSHFAYAETNRMDFQRNGILGAWGNKTQWWYYAQNINKQVAAIDEVLMNSVNEGVIVTGEQAGLDTKGLQFIMDTTSWRELESVEGNTMIGCFNYHGKSALYVVNYETEYAQKVTLNLQNAYNLSITQSGENSKVKTDKLTLDMQPGDGVLVVFE